MRWWPLLVESRFSVPLVPDPVRTQELLVRGEEVIGYRGQRLLRSGVNDRSFGPRWPQFIFYHPFLFVWRSTVEVKDARLHYTLRHPLPPVLAVLFMLLSAGELGAPTALLVAFIFLLMYHGFLFFIHRELIRQICSCGQRGDALIDRARP